MSPARPSTMFTVLALAGALTTTAGGVPQSGGVTLALPSVEASVVGHFSKGCSWRLRVTNSGAAELWLDRLPTPVHRRFNVSGEQLAALQAVVEREEFFSLSDAYGEKVPDGSTTVIGVNLGGREKAVTIRFLTNWVYGDPKRLREPARALRVFQVIRGWFSDDDAVDLGRYDTMVLEAADGPTTR